MKVPFEMVHFWGGHVDFLMGEGVVFKKKTGT